MSTQAIVVITGKNRYGTDTIIRLYKHGDGYPSDTLADLVRATETVQTYILNNAELLSIFRGDGLCPTLDEMPTEGFTAQVIAAGNHWCGSSYRIDDEGLSLAVFTGQLCRSHYGDQGDLEWVYLVDLKARKITIWGGGHGTPTDHIDGGVVDPLSYADQICDEYQEQERAIIANQTDSLITLGWRLTIPAKRNRIRTRKPVTS
jgi:hypothetical protein